MIATRIVRAFDPADDVEIPITSAAAITTSAATSAAVCLLRNLGLLI
jgi:hypothetical protein